MAWLHATIMIAYGKHILTRKDSFFHTKTRLQSDRLLHQPRTKILCTQLNRFGYSFSCNILVGTKQNMGYNTPT